MFFVIMSRVWTIAPMTDNPEDSCSADILGGEMSHLHDQRGHAISQPNERRQLKYLSHPRKHRNIPPQLDWKDERRCQLLVRLCRPFSFFFFKQKTAYEMAT